MSAAPSGKNTPSMVIKHSRVRRKACLDGPSPWELCVSWIVIARKEKRLTKKQETEMSDCKDETECSTEKHEEEMLAIDDNNTGILKLSSYWQKGVIGACMCATGWYLQQECRSARQEFIKLQPVRHHTRNTTITFPKQVQKRPQSVYDQ